MIQLSFLKSSKDIFGIDDKDLVMHAIGLSDKDMPEIVEYIYGFRVRHEIILQIIDRTQPGLMEWPPR